MFKIISENVPYLQNGTIVFHDLAFEITLNGQHAYRHEVEVKRIHDCEI